MPPRIHNAGQATGPEQWFKSLPIVTQYWFGAAVVITLAGFFEVVTPFQLVYVWSRIKDEFELWRLLTAFVYTGTGVNALFTLYMLVTFSQRYEASGPYNTGAGGGTADYVFALMFGAGMLVLTFPLVMMFKMRSPLLTKSLAIFVMYAWSKRHAEEQSNIWGIPIPAVHLPFAYVFISMFIGSDYVDLLHGIAVGHMYYFLVEVVPRLHGRDILVTPQFLIDQLGVGMYRPEAPTPNPANVPRGWAGSQQQQQPPANRGGHQWGGSGRPLGRD